MLQNKYKKFLFSLVLTLLLFFTFSGINATEPIGQRSTCDPGWYSSIQEYGGRGLFSDVSEDCWACGNCTLCDFLTFTTTIAKTILGVVGALAFLMFIYGGFSFIIASGNPEKITQARSIFINAVIGLVIVLAAWEIVHIVVGTLAGQDLSSSVNIFNKEWYNVACEAKINQ